MSDKPARTINELLHDFITEHSGLNAKRAAVTEVTSREALMEYCLIKGHDPDEFAGVVTAMLMKGWQLAGGISIAVDLSNTLRYAQSMTRDARPRSAECVNETMVRPD